jgi:PKD repeat protein
LVGRYCNSQPPPSTPLTINGEYVTFHFISDVYVNHAGFKIEFSCNSPDNPPFVEFDADKTNSCNGIINFIDQSFGAQATSWLWDFGDDRTSTLQNPQHQYYKNGKYSVTLTAGNENGNNFLKKTNFITIENMLELNDQVIEGSSVESFEVFVPNASENLKWYANIEDNLWESIPLFVGNPIQHSAINNEITYYVIDFYDTDECFSELAAITVTPENSIRENIGQRIVVFPNPTSGELQITGYEIQITEVEIFDVYGRKVETKNLLPESIISISNLSSGIYFLRILTDEGMAMKKVIKN